MIDWNLLRCAFGKHKLGRVFYDDMREQWIKVCRHCNKTIVVDPPKDKDGKERSPHEWLLDGEYHAQEIVDGEKKN